MIRQFDKTTKIYNDCEGKHLNVFDARKVINITNRLSF